MNRPSTRGRWLQGGLGLALLVATAAPAAAFQFNLGEVQGSLDTTVSYGLNYRTADRDRELVGIANGGKAYSVNGDDGNLNYRENEFFSKVFKITSDLELKYDSFGLFLRGSAFHDFVNAGGDLERTELEGDALDLVGENAELLDAFLWWDFELGGMPGTLRVGDQVLSWGESTFIQNSINTINPVDVSKLRIPGSELKEALKPVGMVSASLAANEYVSIDAFYQYDWEKTEIDPAGSYWSTTDLVGEGAYKVMLGWGNIPDSIDPGTLAAILANPGIGSAVPRTGDRYADDDGQYGLALHVLAPQLNNTEFGAYFINYHSRLPIISARTGALAGLLAGDYASTARYFVEYPEDIKLYGASFNTQLDRSGIALQGEYSYRQDVPVQVDDVELLMAALSPLDPFLAGRPLAPGITLGADTFSNNQLGPQPFNSVVHGYEKLDISQVQMTATKTFGPTFGADQLVLVGEVGLTHVHNMPGKSELRLESPGTYVSGNTTPVDVVLTLPTVPPTVIPLPGQGPPLSAVAHPGKPAEDSSAFADATSWGYRAVARLDYNNAIGAISLSPRIAWAHDVDGNSPNPGGNFLEHRKAVTIGVEASYQNSWSADLSYTDFFGADRFNLINDRDFVSFNVKYSF